MIWIEIDSCAVAIAFGYTFVVEKRDRSLIKLKRVSKAEESFSVSRIMMNGFKVESCFG